MSRQYRQELVQILININTIEIALNDAYKIDGIGKSMVNHKINNPGKWDKSNMIPTLKSLIFGSLQRAKMIQEYITHIEYLIDPFKVLDKSRTETEVLSEKIPGPKLLQEDYILRIKRNLIENSEIPDLQTGVNTIGSFMIDYANRTFLLYEKANILKKYIIISLEQPDSMIAKVWDIIGLKEDNILMSTNSDAIQRDISSMSATVNHMFNYIKENLVSNDDPSEFKILLDLGIIKKKGSKYIVHVALGKILNIWDENDVFYNTQKILQNFIYSKTGKPFAKKTISNNLDKEYRINSPLE
jgi:hypothetical protein